MSSERHTRNRQSPNSTPRESTELTSIQIASRALASIRDSVRRALINTSSSDDNQINVPANVETEREYPYDANDYSLIAPNSDNVANLRVTQVDNLRRADSFDGSIFGLNDRLQALNNEMAHTPEREPEAPVYSEIDEEIQRLRNTLPRNDEAGPSRRVGKRLDTRIITRNSRATNAISRTAGKRT